LRLRAAAPGCPVVVCGSFAPAAGGHPPALPIVRRGQ